METERRKPTQKRSRERVEQIVSSAAEFVHSRPNDEFNTRALAQHAGIPVATIYRYFRDRDAILAAVVDRDQNDLNREIGMAMFQLKTVSGRSLFEVVTNTYIDYYRRYPEVAKLLLGPESSPLARERGRQRDAVAAAWLNEALSAAGMLRKSMPSFGIEAVLRLADRMFEYVLMQPRSRAEQEAIIHEYTEMVVARWEKHLTKAGVEGIPMEQFVKTVPPLLSYLPE
jgi:AcrR family transcriptional regulator